MRKIYSVFLGMLVILSLISCGKNGEEELAVLDWQEQYDLGMRYLEAGDYEEAIIAFTKAIEIDKKQEDVYLSLADAYIASGQSGKAEEVLIEAAERIENSDKIIKKLEELRKILREERQQTIWKAAENTVSEWKEANMSETPINSAVLCDIDADGIQELLITYMSDDSSGTYEKQIWFALYEYEDNGFSMLSSQKIGEIGYCDAMQARLFFSEQQAAFCIITNRESIAAYTGAREFVSELYKISKEEILQRRYWTQNTVENLEESQDSIIEEMQRVGISHMEMNYFSFETDDMDSDWEVLIFQNRVQVEGDSAQERQYQLLFFPIEEVQELIISDEETALLYSIGAEKAIQEKELKQECKAIIQLAQRLLYGDYGVAVDYEDQITGPHWMEFDDYWNAVPGYSSMEEVKDYVRPLVSDEIYNRFFAEEKYMIQNEKLYFRGSLYGGRMNISSLEIERIDGDVYSVSIDEYLGADIYIGTNVLELQKKDDHWVLLSIGVDQIDKGISGRYIQEADFVE